MNALETQVQLWRDYKAQCASVDGLPDFDQYAALQIHRLRTQLAAVTAERDALKAQRDDYRDAAWCARKYWLAWLDERKGERLLSEGEDLEFWSTTMTRLTNPHMQIARAALDGPK